MLRHYLAVAAAQLARSPLYAVLSIGGLGVGLGACILIALFVRHEVSYDSHLPDVARLYRVHATVNFPGRPTTRTVLTQGPLKEAIARDVPEVELVARLSGNPVVVKQGATAVADEIMLVDEPLFDVLDLPVVRGDRPRIFKEPWAVVVTEEAGRKYFGAADPIGQTIRLCCFAGVDVDARVVGVLRDPPQASHLKLGIVAHLRPGLDPVLDDMLANWLNVGAYTYVKLRPGATPAQVDARLATVIKTHVPPLDLGDMKINPADLLALHLRAVRDLHLAAASDAGTFPDMKPAGDPTTVSTLAIVGALLLLISISNFVNMATARSGRRAREIAVRKVFGASPRDIIVQYLGEAVVIALCALALALALVEAVLPWFAGVMQRSLAGPFAPGDLAILLAATAAIGLAAGAYPALVLSRFQPAAVMKANQTSVAGGAGRLRKVLVFAQFLAAIALVACTAVIVEQARYAASGQLGYDKRDKLVIRNVDGKDNAALRDRLIEAVRRMPSVTSAVYSSRVPTDGLGANAVIDAPGDTGGQVIFLGLTSIEPGFFELYGVAPLAGRLFERARDDPKAGQLIVNLAAVRRLGFPSAEAAIGRTIGVHISQAIKVQGQIIGVVPDVHFSSARFAVEPTTFMLDVAGQTRLSVGVAPGTGRAVLREIEAVWATLAAGTPFEGELLDALVEAQNRDDHLLGVGLAGAGLLALIIAFAGLYGLSSFLTESRTREIAIRKVLGARDRDIVRQLLWQITQPILLACAVALPLAYYLMWRWLDRFAYHLELGPGLFATTGAAAVVIAIATVSAQAIGAARRRPVETLRRD